MMIDNQDQATKVSDTRQNSDFEDDIGSILDTQESKVYQKQETLKPLLIKEDSPN